MFYSPSTGGFYASNAPAGSVEISDARHAELLAGEVNGRRIIPGDGDFPVLSDPAEVVLAFTPLEFLDLFSHAEQVAVVEAGMASAEIKLWYDRMLAASFITRSDPRVPAGLNALVGAGLMTAERAAEILDAMGSA